MVIIRGTRKFLERVGTPSEPDGAFHLEAGRLVRDRAVLATQLPLLVNTTTLLPVFLPFAPAAPVLTRFPDALATVLRAHSIADTSSTVNTPPQPTTGSPRPMTAASSA